MSKTKEISLRTPERKIVRDVSENHLPRWLLLTRLFKGHSCEGSPSWWASGPSFQKNPFTQRVAHQSHNEVFIYFFWKVKMSSGTVCFGLMVLNWNWLSLWKGETPLTRTTHCSQFNTGLRALCRGAILQPQAQGDMFWCMASCEKKIMLKF